MRFLFHSAKFDNRLNELLLITPHPLANSRMLRDLFGHQKARRIARRESRD